MTSISKTTLLFVFVSLAAVFPLSAFSQDEATQEANEDVQNYIKAILLYNEGTHLIQAENYKDAIEPLQKALEADPGYIPAKENLGIAYYNTGEFQKALDQAVAAIEEFPAWHEYKFKMDIDYHNFAKAEIELLQQQQRQILGDQFYAEFRSTLNVNNISIPREDVARIIKLEGKIAEYKDITMPVKTALSIPAKYYFHCGNCFLKLQKWNEAYNAYFQTIQIDPGYAEAHNNLSYILYLAKKYDDSWKHMQLAKEYGANVNPQAEQALKEKLGK